MIFIRIHENLFNLWGGDIFYMDFFIYLFEKRRKNMLDFILYGIFSTFAFQNE